MTKPLRWLLGLFLALGLPTLTLAQSDSLSRITGQVIDEYKRPLELATVVLQRAADSVEVGAGYTEADGSFAFSKPAGTYRLIVSVVGYRRQTISLPTTLAGQTTNVPTVALVPDVKQLQEVKVLGQKPFIEQLNDKLVLNVSNNLAVSGGSALDALEKAPGIQVINDRISLAGRTGVAIYIDGKPSAHTDMTQLLRDIPSSTIDRIELISQPGARYDAAGSAGIINVVLKKSDRKGTHVLLTGSVGYGTYAKSSGGLSFNHRTGPINLFGTYSYSYRKTFNQNTFERDLVENGVPFVLRQQTYEPRTTQGSTFRLGADWSLGKRSLLGVLLNGLDSEGDANGQTDTDATTTGQTQNLLKTRNQTDRRWQNLTANLNYKLTLNDRGHELTVDADMARYNLLNHSLLTTQRLADTLPVSQAIRNNLPTTVNYKAFKLDYVRPLPNSYKLEMGFKLSGTLIDSDLAAEVQVAEQWQPDRSRSNQFSYSEDVRAGYVTMHKNWKRADLQVGLRTEYTDTEGVSGTLNQRNSRQYWQWFPSVFFNQALTSILGVSVSYSRRIDRPGYQDLNPFVYYIDPYTYQRGNPNLVPQLTNNWKATLTYQKLPLFSVGYSVTNNVITQVTEQDPNSRAAFSTMANLDEQHNAYATLNFPLSFAKWLSGYGSLTGFRNSYTSTYLDGLYADARWSYTAFATATAKVGSRLSVELSGSYQGPGVLGLVRYNGYGVVNMGMQYSLANEQTRLRLSANDLFYGSRIVGTVNYQQMNLRIFSLWESRQYRLTLTHAFGNTKLKSSRKRTTTADDERSRVKLEQ
ncbi:TonB-dependent receptor domain-containing protein [Fibrella sp. WM1]|uniref:TonB-dependent receptor domain-containing protein n=1 Tax=Fibrella musci TaxID=3242485 RepID=UPI0035229A64